MSLQQVGTTTAHDFIVIAGLTGIVIQPGEMTVEVLDAPHRPPSSLPKGKLGVYVFMFGNRCLKVGKAGPNSAARFCSQHYGINAPSTLAKSLLKSQSKVGISGLQLDNVKGWIRQHTTRINFLLDSKHGMFALSLLEAFVQCRLQPEFEGFASQREVAVPLAIK